MSVKKDNTIVFVNYFTNDMHDKVRDCFQSCFNERGDCIGLNKETLKTLYRLQYTVDDLIDQVEEIYNLKEE